MIKTAVAVALFATSLSSAIGQAPVPVVLGTAPASTLRTGTEVPMKTREELTTKGKALRVGQRIQLEVAENVVLGGQTIIPAGAPAMAELTSIRNKGAWGKSGNIEGRVLYLRVGDRQIRCSGVFNDKGTTGTAGVVAAVAFIPIAGFLTTGTSAHIPLGAPVKAFLDEDVPVQFAAASTAPAPLIIPAAAVQPSLAGAPAQLGSAVPPLQATVLMKN